MPTALLAGAAYVLWQTASMTSTLPLGPSGTEAVLLHKYHGLRMILG